MSPAELADRIGHTSYAVDGSAVSADGRVKIEIATGRITTADRDISGLAVTIKHAQRMTEAGPILESYRSGCTDTGRWRTATELRAMARHLRDVASDWERAAQVADELRAPKPKPTSQATRKGRRENARFARLDMDVQADQTIAGS